MLYGRSLELIHLAQLKSHAHWRAAPLFLLPQPLVPNTLPYASMSLNVLIAWVSRTMQYWLISLGITSSRIIHVIASDRITFFWRLNNIPLCVYTTCVHACSVTSVMSASCDPMEKALATHSSTLAWKIPWTEEPGGLQSMGSLRVGHDWATSLSLFTFIHWRRKWQSTPVFLPGKSQGWGSLVGCRLWGRTESDMTDVT